MFQQFDATYDGGALRPAAGVQLPLEDGQRVVVTIQSESRKSPQDVLRLAQAVYQGLTPEEVDEVERVATDRSRFLSDTRI